MSKWSKNWKKILAGILVIAMVAGYLPQAKNDVQAATTDVNFDESNVVLKLGVMSDIHLAYGTDSATTIKNKVNNYAKSVATLNAMSENDLDVLMLAGDYTGYGMYEQGKTFTTASGAIMDAINADKEEGDKTQFFFTYGNHDTEWKGQMSYTQWEELFAEEGLMDGLTYGPEASGSYKYTRTVNGKTYYFFSVETETYNTPSNTFRVDVLEWLDEELAATPKNAYVYVVSHGPIKESGVYGADLEFCKNAGWATAEEGYASTITRSTTDGSQWDVSSDINGVLEKYPQVMYFSGHTHYTNTLESSIMSDMYTAITVSHFTSGDLYSSLSNYLDKGTENSKPGYSLYIEVDANGNQRITRVNTIASSLVSSVVLNGIEYTEVTDNPTGESTTKAKIDAYYTDSADITYNESGSASTLTPWIMQVPSADGVHLEAYSSDARREIPVFGEGALEITNVTNTAGESFEVDFTFPTATCENHYVIRYEFTIYDEFGNVLDTRWILGNWTTNTDGVTEEGKTHRDATTLSYSNTYTSEDLAGATGIYATLTAVDEFGGRTTLTYGDKDNLQNVGIMKPTASGANKNMFDGVTTDRTFIASHTDIVKKSFDEKGVATITSNLIGSTDPWTSIRFALSEYKYEKAVANGNTSTVYGSWAAPGNTPEWYTDMEASDTFVYEADFTVSDITGFIEFQIRTADVNDASKDWQTDYNGIRLATDGVSLWADNHTVGSSSTAFKISADNTKHHIIIVSAPKTISVWIDDILVFDQVSYVPTLTDRMNSTTMLPTMGLFVQNFNGTITNQSMYLYDQDAQVKDAYTATDANLFDASKVTYTGTISSTTDETYPTPAIGTNSLGGYAAYNSESIHDGARFDINLDSTKFTANDTVITEFDFTPSGLDCGSDNSSVLHDIRVTFRKNTSGTSAIYLMRTNGNWIDTGSGYVQITGTSQVLKEGTTLHCKIVSGPTSASVYVGGMLVTTAEYTTKDMVPYMEIFIRNGRYKFENISIRKEGDSIEGITGITDENNLLNGMYGEITSTFKNNASWEGKSDSVVSGNNFYTDLTWTNLQENGANGYWMGENFYPFGINNSNINFKGNESFVMTALVRVSNAKLSDGTNTYNHRVGAQVANYNGKSLWYFIDTTTLNVYVTENGANTRLEGINLNTLIGYNVGDYVRLTTSITPFGFDIYMDGYKVYSYTTGDGTNVSYSSTAYTVNGVEARFLDATVHYNIDNVDLYKNKLLNDVNAYEALEGVFFENTDALDAKAAEIKAACESAVTSDELWRYLGVMTEMVGQGKIVNNMVYDGTTVVSKNVIGTFSGSAYAQQFVALFEFGTCPFTSNDTWIIEADVKNYDFINNVPRLGIKLGDSDYIFMFQSNITYYQTSAGDWVEVDSPKNAQTLYNSGNGIEWHVRYEIVKNQTMNVTVTSLDGATTYYTNSYDLSVLIKDYSVDTVYSFNPSFFYSNASFDFSNIYVGYDLTTDIAELDTAVTEAQGLDLSPYTLASAEAFEAVLSETATVNTEIANYVGDATGTIYTTPYSKAEMDAAVTTLANARATLVKAERFVTIGDSTVGVLSVGIAFGETLPQGVYIEDKYIIGWTVDGQPVTEYSGGDVSAYIAEYIDLNMLDVRKQTKDNADNSEKRDIRFIASVNNLDYVKAGFVFSVSNANPAIGGTGCIVKSTTTVYESLWADDELTTVEDNYSGGYSQFLYAWEILGTPNGAIIYARAYVELADGTIVYGASRAVTAE